MFSLGKLFIEYFARIDDYKIKDINAWNFRDLFDDYTFSWHYGNHHDVYLTSSLDFKQLVHQCINENPHFRPTLDDFQKFFDKYLVK